MLDQTELPVMKKSVGEDEEWTEEKNESCLQMDVEAANYDQDPDHSWTVGLCGWIVR